MDDAAYHRGSGHEGSVATSAFADHDFARGPDGTAKVTVNAHEAFYDKVTAKRAGWTEECVDENITGGGHASIVPGDR